MTAAVPGAIHCDERPPIKVGVAPAHPGTAAVLRPTVIPRRAVTPRTVPIETGFLPHDPLVRRYWTAVIGPGAVADLLRLIAAGTTRRSILEPLHMAELTRQQLVEWWDGVPWVASRVPYLDPAQTRRLHPSLQGEYRRVMQSH